MQGRESFKHIWSATNTRNPEVAHQRMRFPRVTGIMSKSVVNKSEENADVNPVGLSSSHFLCVLFLLPLLSLL